MPASTGAVTVRAPAKTATAASIFNFITVSPRKKGGVFPFKGSGKFNFDFWFPRSCDRSDARKRVGTHKPRHEPFNRSIVTTPNDARRGQPISQ